MSELTELRDAISKLHDCESEHVESVPVTEQFNEQTVWDGVVEVFALQNHPRAQRCYAWRHALDGGGSRFVAVLELPPVDSARRAVQVAIAAEARGRET